MVSQQAAKCIAGYVYTSSGIHESTTDMVFGGHSIICDIGVILAETKRFQENSQLIINEIDVDRIINNRSQNTSFMEAASVKTFRKVLFCITQLNLHSFHRYIDPNPFVPSIEKDLNERCEEIFSIQTTGLRKRLLHTNINKVIIGISGGVDSTLALLVAIQTFKLLGISTKNIIAITLPGFGTTDATHQNACKLIQAVGATMREISIKEACLAHFKSIGYDSNKKDITYENVQARERTQILMDIANMENGLVIGTSDLSELALGWCTYNGDHISMYSVNSGVPKTLVRFLIEWIAKNVSSKETSMILQDILNTPISPELLPPAKDGSLLQKTEEIIGPYELHDFFLFHMIRYGAPPKKILFLAKVAFKEKYSEAEIKKCLKIFLTRFFSQQYKRSCLPDGPKVGTISLSPRGDWRMPSDASDTVWINDLDT